MGLMGGDGVEVSDIILIVKLPLHIGDNILVFLFKHIGIDAVIGGARLVVQFVLRNLVDEEQAQYLNTLMKELPFPFNMGEDGLADLDTAELFFADFSDHITGIKFNTVQKLHRVVTPVDEFDHKTVLILIQTAGIVVEIKADTDFHRLFADAGCTLKVKLQSSCGISFGKVDTL